MKLRIKHNVFLDVVLDSRYVRYPRPSIRAYVKAYDKRVDQFFRNFPDVSTEDAGEILSMLPEVPERVCYHFPVIR